MIRIGLALLAGMALALLAVAASGEPGVLTTEWLGWRLDTSAAAGAVLIGVLALLAVGFWRLVIWIAEAPQRAAQIRTDARKRDSYAALARGYLALAAGDADEARRMSRRATDSAEDAPILTGLLAAQAAEASGEDASARAAYEQLLSHPDAQGTARQGLARLSWRAGDRAGALEQARAGEVAGRGGAWAWRMQFDDRLEAGDWDGALALLGGPRVKKVLGADKAARARAALLTARAVANPSESPARDAAKAVSLSPAFVPAAVVAALSEAEAGRHGRGEVILLRAWKSKPHAALAIAYRDLRPDETPSERSDRLARLIARRSDHRESRILEVERAMLSGDATATAAAVDALAGEPDTSRLLDLKARAAWAAGQVAEARTLAARAAEAPIEPDGQTLATITPNLDWARLITVWLDDEELSLGESASRTEPTVITRPAEASLPSPETDSEPEPIWRAPDDPGDWGEDETPAQPDTPEPAPPRRARRKQSKR